MNRYVRMLTDKKFRFSVLSKYGFYNWMSDEAHIRKRFQLAFGRELDLENPVTFNEKLQWLKLYDRKPEYSTMVDKYEAKRLIADRVGEEYVVPVVGGPWSSFEEIDFSLLPDQFVLKTTHDCGGVFVCKDKNTFDKEKARRFLNQHLHMDYYTTGREWPYKNVKPRLFAEKYLSDGDQELYDYKFFCFNGQVKCAKVDFGRFVEHRANYYDRGFSLLPFGENVCPPVYEHVIEKPVNWKKMIDIAEELSAEHYFLRVDLYHPNGKIWVGELTLFPASGFGGFTDDSWDRKLGAYLRLPTDDK